jgi:signal transduction histidine kinase
MKTQEMPPSTSPIRSVENLSVETELEDLRQKLIAQTFALEVQTRRGQEANQMKTAFLAHLSAELRALLNGVVGFSGLVGDRRFGGLDARQVDFVNDLRVSAQYLLRLVDNLSAMVKSETDQPKLVAESFSLREVIAEVSAILQVRMAAKEISFSKEIHLQDDRVVLDRQRISQILYSLLSNAIKFTPAQGSIILRVVSYGDKIEIVVMDTGVGIKKEDLAELFTETAGVATAGLPASAPKEAGIGLMMIKKLIALHGGSIWVESVPGRGSMFILDLPRALPSA